MAVREIDAGMTEVLRDRLLNDGETFDGSDGYTVALEILQVGGVTWLPATAYAVGDLVRPVEANGRLYACWVSGTSDASNEPVWPTTHGAQVADGDATWIDITPTAGWYMAEIGEVAITDYDRLPPDTSYRVRYVVTDTSDHTGPFPNLNRYNTWRVGAVMAG